MSTDPLPLSGGHDGERGLRELKCGRSSPVSLCACWKVSPSSQDALIFFKGAWEYELVRASSRRFHVQGRPCFPWVPAPGQFHLKGKCGTCLGFPVTRAVNVSPSDHSSQTVR